MIYNLIDKTGLTILGLFFIGILSYELYWLIRIYKERYR